MSFIEYLLIGVLVILQVFVFIYVWKKINAFKAFFPATFKNLQIQKFYIAKEALNNPQVFDSFLEGLNKNPITEGNDNEAVELLVISDSLKATHPEFSDVVKSTNAYLCKNKGASADFNILQDICERHLQKLDNGIGNLINVPLYIGLGGTFLGIIIGLSGIDFAGGVDGAVTISTDSIGQLLSGVIAAMIASLVGLGFTVWNTALNYKPAAYQNETDKNNYYDFIQRELLPVLNIGMAGSLTNFRSVLDHFIVRFGENIGDYKQSAELLNTNLKTQQVVLEEINKLNLVRTSTKIAEVFVNLKESSEHLDSFKQYQKGLNEALQKTEKVANDINATIVQYKDFNTNLNAMAAGLTTNFELQNQFKSSLEKHFPTIADHREIWRKQVDELNTDIKEVYRELTEYFKVSNGQIQSFIDDNHSFFSGVQEIQQSIKVFVNNSIIQNEQFKMLQQTMTEMRNDMKQSQQQSIETNREIIEVLKTFNKQLVKLSLAEDKV